MTRSIRWLFALPLLSAYAFAEDKPGVPLVNGEAVYDLSLDPKDVNGGLAGLEGEFRYRYQKICEAYETEIEMGVDIIAPGDHAMPLVTWGRMVETASALDFAIRNDMAGIRIEEAKGVATRSEGTVSVEPESPDSPSFVLDGDVLFPTQMMLQAIEAAGEGRTVAEYEVFAGADDDTGVLLVSVVISPVRAEVDGDDALFASAMGFDQMDRWQMTFGYFPRAAATDGPPMLTVSGTVYANGFMQAGVYDYGTFAMRFALSEFKPLAPVPCS